MFAAFTVSIVLASAAAADEFEIGVLLDPDGAEPASAAFVDGFVLAVDQSPDVSHPPGAEGGDHLGGMDVVVIVDDRAGVILRDPAPPIIVADASPDRLAEIAALAATTAAMLIVVSDGADIDMVSSPGLFVGDLDRLEPLLRDRPQPFEAAFVAAYGRAPTAAATRGYLAGRLVDLGIEATDRDPSDHEALVATLVAAGRSAPVAGREETSSDVAVVAVIVAGLVVVLATIAVVRGVRSKRRQLDPTHPRIR